MALQVGSRLGHYEVTALIGEGGMGQVYQATDTKLNRLDLERAHPSCVRSVVWNAISDVMQPRLFRPVFLPFAHPVCRRGRPS